MKTFKFCYPDANTFNKVIRLKPINDFNAEYVKLDKEIGYWVTEDPFCDDGYEIFKELISCFPIQKDNNHPDNLDPNPFDTIHVPEWVSDGISGVIEEFYRLHTTNQIFNPQRHEWGNVYFKERTRPITCWRIPHIDYVYGMVANLWFTDHSIEDSGTKIYRYHGKMYNEIYDFQQDPNHPKHEEWKSLATVPVRANSWFNILDSDLASWGFEYLGTAPTKEKTMTMYNSNICHLAYISENIDFRWSHTFAFSHESPPQTLGEIFK